MPYFPPDARYLTEYRSSCEVNRDFVKKANIKDSKELSIWIQKNALDIQKSNFAKISQTLQAFNM